MPHKHKRKRDTSDTDFDLPPTQRARPLPVGNNKQASSLFTDDSSKKKGKGKKKNQDNDTPRAFRRLMAAAQGKKTRSGLDNGDAVNPTPKVENKSEELKIRPGEDMRSFSARVNASLPVSGLTKKTQTKDGKDEIGMKVWRTNKERKMHRLYDQWREEERKIQEQREEELEEAAARELEEDNNGPTRELFDLESGKHGGGKKKKGKAGNDDPWAVLKKKRKEARVGLHDVAQAPPELNKDTSRYLKVASDDAAVEIGTIPKKAGSLKRREDLQAAREETLEAYRRIREHEQKKLNAKEP